MAATSPDLNLPNLTASLADQPVGHTIHYHARVTSTMPLAHALAATSPSGTVILADEQTQGRGRLARRWDAPPGLGLLLSVLIKPPYLPEMPAQLPMIGGLAVAAALEDAWPSVRGHVWLKWPNDILLGRTPTDAGKVGGLLIESALTGAEMSHAVLGLGLNVHQGPGDLPGVAAHRPRPTSLALFAQEMGTPPLPPLTRGDLLRALCLALGDLLAAGAPSPDQIHARWQARLITLGQTVTVWPVAAELGEAGKAFIGTAVATDLTGELIVRSAGGEDRRFSAGDVSTGQPPLGE